MKPELEQVDLKNAEQSFRFFKTEVDAFVPFWHYHPELELTFIINGDGTRFVGDSIEPFNDFDLVLLGKNLPHHWVSAKEEKKMKQKAVIFQFDENIFNGLKECRHFKTFFDLASKGIYFENPSKTIIDRILSFETLGRFEQLIAFMELIEDLSKQKDQRFLVTDSYMHVNKSGFNEEKFSMVNNYILEHLNHSITVNHMAEITHMVPQSFCRWFKKHSGHSFINFLNRTRVERACHELLTSSNSIQNIAFSCGFETISHFNRTFKSFKGCNPSHFKKNHKKSQ